MAKPAPKFEIATAPGFRAWLVVALERTNLRPAAVSLGIGASVNLVGSFQRDLKRDITLTRAAAIERYLRNAAADMRVKLPKISEAAALAGVSDV